MSRVRIVYSYEEEPDIIDADYQESKVIPQIESKSKTFSNISNIDTVSKVSKKKKSKWIPVMSVVSICAILGLSAGLGYTYSILKDKNAELTKVTEQLTKAQSSLEVTQTKMEDTESLLAEKELKIKELSQEIADGLEHTESLENEISKTNDQMDMLSELVSQSIDEGMYTEIKKSAVLKNLSESWIGSSIVLDLKLNTVDSSEPIYKLDMKMDDITISAQYNYSGIGVSLQEGATYKVYARYKGTNEDIPQIVIDYLELI